MTDLRADESDTVAFGLAPRIDGQGASLGLDKEDGAKLVDVRVGGGAPTAENADIGTAGRMSNPRH